MTELLVDSSILIAWFHEETGPEWGSSVLLREALAEERLEARVIDLAVYEVGNVLLRRLGWTSEKIAGQLDDLNLMCGAPLVPGAAEFTLAGRLGEEHGLSFYDAAWAASAKHLGIPLVSTDRALVEAGLAELPSAFAARLGL